MSKLILPDVNSWLNEHLINFCQILKNEFNLSLWDALNEFVNHFSPECAYLGYSADDDLSLYFKLSYDSNKRTAKINKMFFVSERVRHILSWDYLSNINEIIDKKKINTKKLLIPKEFEDDFPGLNFFSSHNNLTLFEGKEVLLRHSYQRNQLMHLIIVENEFHGYHNDCLNKAIITYDLSFLENCGFFKSIRYQSFKNLLPPNLMLEIPVTLPIEVKSVPKKLKQQQLIYVN